MRKLALIVFLFGSSLAWADDGDEARRHFDAGNAAYSVGQFAHAADEYRAAYKAKPDPTFLYNVAQAYRSGGDARQAIAFYRSFLRHQPKASNRREIEERIGKLEAQLAGRTPPAVKSTPAPHGPKPLRDRDPYQTPPINPRLPSRTEPAATANDNAAPPQK